MQQYPIIIAIKKLTIVVGSTIGIIAIASCAVSNYTGQHSGGDIVPLTSTMETQYLYHPKVGDPQRPTSLAFGSSLSVPKALVSSNRNEHEKFMNQIEHSPEAAIMDKFGRAAMKVNSWQEVHRLAIECIAKTTGTLPAFYVHQLIASTMLKTYFLLHNPTPDIQEAVGYYMNILIKYENYSDANLKSLCLPILIGYWPNEKVIEVAQKNFNNATRNKVTVHGFLQDYSQKRQVELTKQLPEKYAQMTSSQFATKVQADLETAILTFPKRSKPFPDLIHDTEECLKFDKDTPESIAVLALLAQGKFAPSANK